MWDGQSLSTVAACPCCSLVIDSGTANTSDTRSVCSDFTLHMSELCTEHAVSHPSCDVRRHVTTMSVPASVAAFAWPGTQLQV